MAVEKVTSTTTTIKLTESDKKHTLISGENWELKVKGIVIASDIVPEGKTQNIQFDIMGIENSIE